MSIERARIVVLVAIAVLVSQLAGCAAGTGLETGIADYVPSDAATRAMSPGEARQLIEKLVREYKGALYSSNGIVNSVEFPREGIVFNTGNNSTRRFWFASLMEPALYCKWACVIKLTEQKQGGSYILSFSTARAGKTRPEAERLADAIYVLKHSAQKAAAENDAQFTASLAEYRQQASALALPEQGIRFKAQAEAAVRDKRFFDAVDFYGEALGAAPWWAQGYFNRALVFGELGEYRMAAHEMKRYLALVPDATNARAAQDKIYEWEGQSDSGKMPSGQPVFFPTSAPK